MRGYVSARRGKYIPMTQRVFFVVVATAFITVSAQSTPRSVADELLAADRAFASAATKHDVVTALSAMFGPDVVLTHAGGIAYGKDQATEALKASPINAGARIEGRRRVSACRETRS